MIRWVKTHPYTTATPVVTAALIALLRVATGLPWWRCAAAIGFFWIVAFMGACAKRRGW